MLFGSSFTANALHPYPCYSLDGVRVRCTCTVCLRLSRFSSFNTVFARIWRFIEFVFAVEEWSWCRRSCYYVHLDDYGDWDMQICWVSTSYVILVVSGHALRRTVCLFLCCCDVLIAKYVCSVYGMVHGNKNDALLAAECSGVA